MFVAINYIDCKPFYRERFEELFSTRKKAIDKMPGFKWMNVLKPDDNESPYLIMSYWESEDNFKNWTKSEAFIEGHKRGFADIQEYRDRGEEAPMSSNFKTYSVLTD